MTTESKMSGNNTLERREREDKKLAKGLWAIFWPRNFVQAEKSLKKKAFAYNPTTTSTTPFEESFSWSFRMCDISGRETFATLISRIRELSCCALLLWGIFASRKFRIVDFSYLGFVIRPPVVSGSFRRGVFRRGVVSNACRASRQLQRPTWTILRSCCVHGMSW